jgi:hypothetical protein
LTGNPQTGQNRAVSNFRAEPIDRELMDQRLLEAAKAASSRRWRIQRRHFERDTRRDTDAAGTNIERHHSTERP